MDFRGYGRSNYVHVAREGDFLAFCRKWGLAPLADPEGRVGFTTEGLEEGLPEGPLPGWLDLHPGETDLGEEGGDGEYTGPDLGQELGALLRPGQVAIVVQVGGQGFRYLLGEARVIPAGGVPRALDLTGTALEWARALDPDVTAPES